MKFQFIADHRETFKTGRMCQGLKVSRSGFHAWFKRPGSRRSRTNRVLKIKICVLHAASHGIYGAPKIHQDLINDGVQGGKKRVSNIDFILFLFAGRIIYFSYWIMALKACWT